MTVPGVLSLIACAALALQDRVLLADGRAVEGTVSSATLDSVAVQAARGEQKIPGRDVVEIEFGRKPDALRAAEAFLRGHDFQNAVNGLEAAAALRDPWWAEPYARLLQAEALLAWADLDPSRAAEAAEAFGRWLARHGESWFTVRARFGQARAASLAGRTEEASRQLEELAAFAFQKNLAKPLELEARLERAEAYLRGGEAQVAESRLRDLVPETQQAISSGGLPRAWQARTRALLVRSQVSLGNAIAARSGLAAARPYWEKLATDSGAGPAVQAAATLGLAQAARAEGRPREAQLLLARIVATLAKGEELLPQALYELGEVCVELNNSPTPGSVYFRVVAEEYPRTSWAVKARQRLSR